MKVRWNELLLKHNSKLRNNIGHDKWNSQPLSRKGQQCQGWSCQIVINLTLVPTTIQQIPPPQVGMVEGIGGFIGIKMLHVIPNLFQLHGNIGMCCEMSHVIIIMCCCNNLIHNIDPILMHGYYNITDENPCSLMLKTKKPKCDSNNSNIFIKKSMIKFGRFYPTPKRTHDV